MEKNIEVTILIPALNEENTINIVIEKAFQWLKVNMIAGEVLVVNNNSIDKTKEIAINNGARVVDVKEKGYGNAIIGGIQNAKGKYIIMGDADDSYNFLEISDFYKYLKAGYDIVIGNRFYKMEKGAMKWSHRYIGTPLLTYIFNKRYKVGIRDINCGLRGVKTESMRKLNLKKTGMELASEMLIESSKKGLEIKEIPIYFYKDKRRRKSHLCTISDGIRHLKVILN